MGAISTDRRTHVNSVREQDTALDAPADGTADRLGDRFAGHRPGTVTAGIALVGAIVLGAIVIGLGILLTEVLLHGAVGRWDEAVSRWFVSRRTPTLNTVTQYGSDIGATLTIIGVALVSSVALAIARRWRAVELIVVSLVVEFTVFLTATIVIDRARPDVPRLDVSPPTSSYPSGHTAAAIALYMALAVIVGSLTANRLARALAWILAIVLPTVVAVSRLYRGMHHLTDVLASVVLGIGALLIALLAVRTGAAVADRRAGSAGGP
jgi:membrane-associated phospholipid phosphatase